MPQYRPLSLAPGKFHWAICDCCEGSGSSDHPAFSNGITSSEWQEWDEDEREGYLRGRYDVPCAECGGSGKVQIPIISALSFAEKRALVEARRREEMLAEMAAERRAEMRHCGYEC